MTVLPSSIERPFGVLFVGHGNSGQSLLAEAIFNDVAAPDLRAFSAGVRPVDHADPFALSALALSGISHEGLWPKHWLGFSGCRGQLIDTIILLGDPVPEFLTDAFVGQPDIHTWHKIPSSTDGDRQHQAWTEIQRLKPMVKALVRSVSVSHARSNVPHFAEAAE